MEVEPTKLRLSQALIEAGLPELAERAAEGLYDDIESDYAAPLAELANELAVLSIGGHAGAKAMRQRLINGEFDTTEAEWEAYGLWHGLSEED